VELGSGANNVQVSYNFDTGALTNVSSGTQSVISSSAQSFGNGWVRITVVFTGLITSTNCTIFIGGVLNDFVYIYGAQLEAGAYATSYIPTLAASATRGAEIATKTGITSLIGQTEGTLFVDFQTLAISSSNHSIFSVENPSTDLVRLVQDSTNGRIRGQVYLNSGAINFDVTTTFPLVVGTRYKAAFAYKSGNFAVYVNGTSLGTSTTTVTFPTLSATSLNIYFGGGTLDPGRMTTNQAILFKTRLTNAELAELTTI
jgi:hypothetical protein